MIKKIFLVLLTLLTASCSTFNVPLDSRLDSSVGKGLAVFSFTSQGALSNFNLHYRDTSNGTEGAITQWTLKDTLDWEDVTRGRLVTMELPEGKYELYKLRAPHISSRGAFSIPFEITAGKAVYFGNVHVNLLARSLFTINISDESDRDISLFLSKYSNISKEDVVTMISKFEKGA